MKKITLAILINLIKCILLLISFLFVLTLNNPFFNLFNTSNLDRADLPGSAFLYGENKESKENKINWDNNENWGNNEDLNNKEDWNNSQNLPDTLNILTQNTMLIPFSFVAPDFKNRASYIAELLPSAESAGFDIIGLQEVFWDFGREMIINSWNGNAIPDTYSTSQDFSNIENPQDIKVLDIKPAGNSKPARIIYGTYHIAGPDTCSWNILKQDSGLLILSRYPVLEAAAFSFLKASGSDRLANKGVLYAKIRVGDGENDYIHFFTTHLQSHGYSETRLENLQELLDFVKNIVLKDSDGNGYTGSEGANGEIGNTGQSELSRVNPVIICGDLNVRADMPSGWLKKAGILAAPEDVALPDDMDSSLNKNSEYSLFLEILESFSQFKLTDAWLNFYPDEPGFTWAGKNWQIADSNPYGSDGNNYAIESGPPERIDYIFYFEGSQDSGLRLSPSSIKLFPEDSGQAQLSDHLGLQLTINMK